MMFSTSSILAGISMLSLALAAPSGPLITSSLEKRTFSCAAPVAGLTAADCNHMSTIGMAGMGANAKAANGGAWIGTQGPNTFNFVNSASAPVTVVVWVGTGYEISFVNVRAPAISYSLAAGQSVTVSIANGVSGGFAGLYNQKTTLSQYGQIYNTWGEFTTGASATVDVSREVNMAGNAMSIQVNSGCVSNMSKCVFTCKSGSTCGDSGTYNLLSCAAGSQPGASYGIFDGNPTGGCQGFNNGGKVTVTLSN